VVVVRQMADNDSSLGDLLTTDLHDSDVPPPPPLASAPGSPLAGLGPETIKRIALQSRRLVPSEAKAIKDAFGDAVNPDDIRIAFDRGAAGTNLRGYVISKELPTVEFFPTDTGYSVPTELLHETTHVWQNLLHRRYTAPETHSRKMEQYQYNPALVSEKTFPSFATEQQGDIVKNDEPGARRFIQQHPASRPFQGDLAFLDSVRQRYQTKTPGYDPARYHAGDPGAFTAVKDLPESLGGGQVVGINLRPKLAHEKVLDNLRAKFPQYANADDGKVLGGLLAKYPQYRQHVGPTGVALAQQHNNKIPKYDPLNIFGGANGR